MNLIAASLVTCVLGGLLPTPKDSSTLATATDGLAKDVKAFLAPQGHTEVVLGAIRGPSARAATGGPGIVELLSRALVREGVTVKSRQARIAIDGTFSFVAIPSDHPDDKLRGAAVESIRIELIISDDNGKELTRISKEVLDEGDQAALDGRSFDAPVDKTRAERDEVIKKTREAGVHVANTRVRARPESPFALEVVRNGKSLPLVAEDGLAFVKLHVADEYEVRVVNDAPFEVAVKLTIDGISMFAFSEVKDQRGAPPYEFMIVAAKSTTIIKGWHITHDKADRFRIVPAERSAAARLGHTQKIGTLTAVFRAAWPENAKPPEGELATTARGGLGTDRGSRVDQSLREVRRHIGRVRAAVSIRYDNP